MAYQTAKVELVVCVSQRRGETSTQFYLLMLVTTRPLALYFLSVPRSVGVNVKTFQPASKIGFLVLLFLEGFAEHFLLLDKSKQFGSSHASYYNLWKTRGRLCVCLSVCVFVCVRERECPGHRIVSTTALYGTVTPQGCKMFQLSHQIFGLI